MAKKIISYVLAFIIIILLTSSVLCTIISNALLNEKFVLEVLEKNEYYSKIYNEIMQNFKNNTIQSGLEENVLDGIISEEQVKKDIIALIGSIYENKDIKINTETVKTKLQQNINEVIAENNKKVSKDEQEEIDIYINTIANIYKDGIVYEDEYIHKVSNVVAKLYGLIKKVKIILYIATIVIAIIVIILNKIESIKFFSISTTAIGILLIITKIIEIITMKTQNILILNQAFSKIVINIIEVIMSKFLIYGIVFLIVGMLLNIASNVKFHSKKH